MAKRTCTVLPCDGTTRRSSGLCDKHHRRMQRHGTTDDRPRVRGTCSLDDCHEPHEAKGLCAKHYERLRKHGSPEMRSRVRTTPEHQAARARLNARAYYWRHHDRILTERRARGPAYGRAYRAAHREQYREHSRRWYRAHRQQAMAANKRWCSTNAPAARENWRIKGHRRRALKRSLPAEVVRPLEIYERDRWTCHLCGGRIDRAIVGRYHPDRVSLDHIIPLASVGSPGHVWENLAAAHLRCNIAKGNAVTDHDRELYEHLTRQRLVLAA